MKRKASLALTMIVLMLLGMVSAYAEAKLNA